MRHKAGVGVVGHFDDAVPSPEAFPLPGAGGNVVRRAQRWDLERQVRLVGGSLVVTGFAGGKVPGPVKKIP